MKITFLGTSHGVPSAERYCSCTMIEAGGYYYFIDAGAPLIDLLTRRGIDLTRVRAIFTTHLHSDHTDGILSLTGLFSWYYKNTSIDVYLTEQHGIDVFHEVLNTCIGSVDDARVRFRLMDEHTVYDDGILRLTPTPTQHLAHANRPAFGYTVEAEGRRVHFSGDLSQWLAREDFPAPALNEELDLLVCEMAHFTVDQALPYLQRCRAKEVLFNHVFPLDKLDAINALNGTLPYPIRTLADNDVWGD